jgi:hypothetical protein
VARCVPSDRWEGGECGVADLGSFACTQSAGCRVRARACCECNADVSSIANLIAVPNGTDVAGNALCEPGQACDDCVASYPDGVTARCSTSGRCELLVDGAVVGP